MVSFSIITAFYYGNQYVPTLIDVAENNLKSLKSAGIEASVELLIINDSPNIEVQIPKKELDITLKIIEHQINSGIHQARVTGLKNCVGDYIVFLDQDDELSNDSIFQEYKLITNADVVVANAYIEKKDGKKYLYFKREGQYLNAFDVNTYIRGHNQIISPGQCLIRKDAIPIEWSEFIMNTKGSDDLFLWLLMLYCEDRFIMCDKVVYTHKYTGSNLSSEEKKMAASSVEIAEYMRKIEYVPDRDIDVFVRNRLIKICWNDKSLYDKMKTCLSNLDIFAPRLYWKLRALLSRRICVMKYGQEGVDK